MSDLLKSIEPSGKATVMSLVSAAGIDVSDWSNYNGAPAANPKYCYKWAFVESGSIVVTVWHHTLFVENDEVVLRDNLRERAEQYRGQKSGTWRRRAEEFDAAMRGAFVGALPVKVMLVTRNQIPQEGEKSEVASRQLDSLDWVVTEYDEKEGGFALVRGGTAVGFSDQFSVDSMGADQIAREETSGTRYVRDPAVRTAVLARAMGFCEHCGGRAFRTPRGMWYLETHHVHPLSEGGPDSVSNVAALCPNHHREAHYGDGTGEIRRRLEARLQASEP